MSEAVEITAPSLAVVEKKPQRRGGCVGVFFQLFDWNRRFAKKKLFSKKLLSPGRLKQASKKFGGDEKQAKHRLIADENNGGFPNGKKCSLDIEPRRETRAPSLVAKLMGLEAMPAALLREKSKKVKVSGLESKKADKVEDEMGAYSMEELNLGKGRIKEDLRPPKLQKTSCSERRSMTRFGADTLPIKNMLSRSKKPHSQLPVPVVKSPRNLSRKNSSKLIGVAARILEPGLQASRSNRALTYSNIQHHPPMSNNLMEDSDNFERASPVDQSCRGNRCHLLNDDNLGPKCCTCSNEHPFVSTPSSNRVEFSCQLPERSTTRLSKCHHEFEGDLHVDDYSAAGSSFVDKLQPFVNHPPDVSSFTEQMQQNSSQQMKPKKDLQPSLRCNQRMQNYNQTSRPNSNFPPRSKFVASPSNSVQTTTDMDERKSFVSPNRSFVSSNRSSSGNSRVENFEMEKRISMRQNDLASPERKRRPINVPRQSEGSNLMNSAGKRQTTHGTIAHAVSTKDSGYNVHSACQQSRRSGLAQVQRRAVCNSPGNNNASFTFSSQAKQKTGVHAVEKRRVRNDSGSTGTTRKSAPNENVRAKLDKPASLSGDALGALLEQKLKELNSQGEDMGGHAPKKTTAMILQELISALTTEMPFLQDNSESLSCDETKKRNESRMSNPKSYTSSKAKATGVKLSADQSLGREHLSPGSVLETFSSESCLSSSHDDNLGYKMSNESMDCCSSSEPHSLNPDSEFLDSANSVTTPISSKDLVMDILDVVSETLCCMNLVNYGLKGSKLVYAREVLLNAELMFQNASCLGSDVKKESSIKHLLLDELETLATVLWMNFGPALGVEDSEEVNQLMTFAFDSIVEYLALRFDRYLKSGSKVSQKLPLCMSTNLLLFDVVEEVRRWKELSRFKNDELIDLEMGRSLREWTEFEPERYETGIEISKKILQTLLDELSDDLCYC